jgi:hypothetical protein
MPRRSSPFVLVAIGLIGVVSLAGLLTRTKLLHGKGVAQSVDGVAKTLASSVAEVASMLPGMPSAPPDSGTVDAGPTEERVVLHRQTAPLSTAQLSAPLVHGKFVVDCGAPDSMKVVMKLDVRMGRALSVSVKTQPPDRAIASCIERKARELRWDSSPKTGHVTVTY